MVFDNSATYGKILPLYVQNNLVYFYNSLIYTNFWLRRNFTFSTRFFPVLFLRSIYVLDQSKRKNPCFSFFKVFCPLYTTFRYNDIFDIKMLSLLWIDISYPFCRLLVPCYNKCRTLFLLKLVHLILWTIFYVSRYIA